jgi:selenocysteine lyase/cysteine desulfurase
VVDSAESFRFRAYCRRILARLPQPSMLHQWRRPFLVPSRNRCLSVSKPTTVEWCLRLSPHYCNTEDEVVQVVAAIMDLAARGTGRTRQSLG